ncbi:MAG: SPOR domain-containing protein [Proteobacteria bacterium]|nr:SPOR domain-containing protein [Pseudomonadota bacterium]
MKQGTKQRIVGTVVLLALALIFLPIVFDGQGSYQNQMTSRIPEAPIVTILPEPQQFRPLIIADAEPVAPDSDPAPAVETAQAIVPAAQTDSSVVEVSTSVPAFTREIPSLDRRGLPQGWSVRLGSFADAANANNLLQRLQAAGYKAYARSINSQQGTLTAVYVGPWLERMLVDDYQQRLQDEFQLAGMVVRYEVEQL